MDRTYTEHKEDDNITLKLLNIQGLTKTKIIEIERLLNKQSVLFLTETQQKYDKTNLSPAYLKYMSMRDQQEKKRRRSNDDNK